MKPFSADTDPAAHAVQVRVLSEMTGAQRLAVALRLRRAADEMALARLRQQYPDDGPRERRLRLAALRLPAELMRAAFGWDPDVEGR